VTSNFNDPDTNDTLTYSASGLPVGLSIDATTGIISGTPDGSASQGGPDNDGVYSVTVTATDPQGETAEQTFTWTVANVAPIANNDAATTDQDTAIDSDAEAAVNGVLFNDISPDGDPLTVSAVNGNAFLVGQTIFGTNGGLFTLNADGSYTFDPNDQFNSLAVNESATTSITYTVSDGEGGTDTAVLEITVTGVNDDPEAQNDIAITGMNTVVNIDVLDNDTDPDTSDVLVVSEINGSPVTVGTPVVVSNGQVTLLGNGTLDFEPALGFDGPVTFDYTVSDQNGGTDTATVTVSVISVDITDNASPSSTTTPDDVLAGIDDLANTVITGRIPPGGTLLGLEVTDGTTILSVDPASIAIFPNGTFTATVDVSSLNDGNIDVSLMAQDSSGNSARVDDNILKDTVTEVSIDPLIVVNGEIPVVTGTGEPVSTITITITVDGAQVLPTTTTVAPDGTWSFTPSSPISDTIFKIQADAEDRWGNTVDELGDPARDTRNIPALEIEDVNGGAPGDMTVLESGLPGGSSPESDDIQKTGTFTLASTDDLKFITVAGTSVSKADLDDLGTDPVGNAVPAITTTYGEIKLIGFVGATGVVTYEYTLTENTTDHEDPGPDTVSDNIVIAVTDIFGDTRQGTLEVVVVDDVPVAEDVALVSVDEGGQTITGNVMTDGTPDRVGADGARVYEIDYTDINGDPQTATVPDGSTVIVTTQYGALTIESDGSWSYTSNLAITHTQPANDHEVSDNFSYRLIDGDGDISNTATQLIDVLDTEPEVGTPNNQSVSEEHLLTGSNPDSDKLIKTGSLDLNLGADAIDTTFDAAQPGLAGFTSNNKSVVFSISSNDHVLTATADGSPVFEVTITNPTAANAGYSFVLQGPLDHLAPGANLVPEFAFTVTDADGDTAIGTFQVEVVDDDIGTTQSIGLDEDDDITFNTTADANEGNTTITVVAGFGDAVVNPNGTITYTPYSNYSGPDSFQYTTTGANGDTVTVKVNVTVNPVADAPTFTSAAAEITTPEDVAIVIGFNAPVVTDDTQASLAVEDFPERLGPITLSDIPSDAQLLDGTDSDALLFTSTGDPITIVISDGATHINGVTGDITMTVAQFEALTVLPPEHDADNFDISASVTSFEVDSNGDPLPGVPGETTSLDVKVRVIAVTDEVTLSIDGNPEGVINRTIDEDTTLDLAVLLSADFEDLDGSENREIIIANPTDNDPILVNGTEVPGGESIPIQAPGLSTDPSDFPSITIRGGQDFSGDLVGITVTLRAKDTDDDDNLDYFGDNPGVEESTVTLNLFVEPVVDEPTVTATVTTDEDTAVKFMEDLGPADVQGTETITGIEIKAVPDGWVIQDHNGVVVHTGNGSADFTVDSDDVNSGDYKNYTIKPPAHDSNNTSLDLAVTVEDEQTVNGVVVTKTDTFTLPVEIQVRPVAEVVGGDSDGDGTDDLTINPDHAYTTNGFEDEWFALNQGDFDLKDGWKNQDDDGSEKTYALLTPVLAEEGASQGNEIGSSIRYSTDGGTTWVTETFNGSVPIEVPMAYLNTVQFKAAPFQAAVYDIKVEAKTVDTDPNDSSYVVEATSGEATLSNIFIHPVANLVTLAVKNARGDEDSQIPLDIKPTSPDASEIFRIIITDVPTGSILNYNGVNVDADGSGNFVIENFDSSTPLWIQPPEHSNVNFTLNVTAESVDEFNGETSTRSTSLPLSVRVRGVADEASITHSAAEFAEVDIDNANGEVALSSVITQVESPDSDGSETITLKISGLDPAFSVVGASYFGGTGAGRTWLVEATNLANVKISVPQNFSGTVKFNANAITTEDDGDSLTGPDTPILFRVTPSPEATITQSSSLTEDSLGKVDFDIQHQNGDTDETLNSVWLNQADIDAMAIQFYFGNATTTTLLQAANDVGNTEVQLDGGWYKLSGTAFDDIYAQAAPNLSGNFSFKVRYEVTDPVSDGTTGGSLGPVTTQSPDTNYSLVVNAVTDTVEIAVASIDSSNSDFTMVDNTQVTATGNVSITVNVETAKAVDSNADNERDYDGSEQLLFFRIDGVPKGVTVTGADFIGQTSGNLDTGQWLLDMNQSFDGPITTSISFNLEGSADELANLNQNITITAFTQDTGPGGQAVVTERTSWTLVTPVDPSAFNATGADTLTPPPINTWQQETFSNADEDASFKLGDIVSADVGFTEPDTTDTFTITLTSLPAGTGVTGMTETQVAGETVWTASGTDQAGLESLLDSIQITPPQDWNDNNQPGGLSFDVTLTTYAPNGQQNVRSINVAQSINPVTDPASIAINPPATEEGATSEFNISLSNSADGEFSNLVDGRLYIQLDETLLTGPGSLEGTLSYDGFVLVLESVTGVAGITDGDYYVLEGQNMAYTPELTYKAGEFAKGDVSITVFARVQETNSTEIKTSSTSATIEVAPVNSGFDLAASDVDGLEDKLVALSITGSGLADASESVQTVILQDVRNGFLVYFGPNSGDVSMATNAGGDGSTNDWLIPTTAGELPGFIGLMPPIDWSGSLSDLTLSVISGEPSLDPQIDSVSFDVTVLGVADGIALTPTLSFGVEGDKIALNLNANMGDLDGSETVTLTLSGLGEFAAFYTNGGADLMNWTYDVGTDTYTLAGITPAQINDISFVQAAQAITSSSITVTAKTIDDNSFAGQSNDESTVSSTTAQVEVSAVSPTSGDDTLLYSGQPIDALGGNDSVRLRYGESVTGDNLATNLSNVETISMTGNGDNAISALSVQNVIDITNSSNVLYINGDSGDSLTLSDNSEWTLGTGVSGYKAYVNDLGTVTLYVAEDINQSAPLEDQSGIVIDGIIEGMYYETSSGLTGYTDAEGSFNFRAGDSVTFSVGGVILGTASPEALAEGLLFLQDLAGVERTNLSNDYVQKMAVFLQSLDSVGTTEDGIQISQATRDTLSAVSLNLVSASMEEVVATLIEAGYAPVSVEEAMEHVRDMLIIFDDNINADDFDLSDFAVDEDSLAETLALMAEQPGLVVLDEDALLIDAAAFAEVADVGGDDLASADSLPALEEVFVLDESAPIFADDEQDIPLGELKPNDGDVYIDAKPVQDLEAEETTDF
uniref:Ig-like domain-containing protein n=1 Tax=Thiomicrospira microaerophila TaxID=406020 RepID=UPI0005C8007C